MEQLSKHWTCSRWNKIHTEWLAFYQIYCAILKSTGEKSKLDAGQASEELIRSAEGQPHSGVPLHSYIAHDKMCATDLVPVLVQA